MAHPLILPRINGNLTCNSSKSESEPDLSGNPGSLLGGNQHRDGAVEVLNSIRHRHPWLRHVFADDGYGGEKLKSRLTRIGSWTVQVVKRTDQAKGFELLPRRWVVERTFAWLGRCRRLAKDVEKTIESAEAWILVANLRFMTRRLARCCQCS